MEPRPMINHPATELHPMNGVSTDALYRPMPYIVIRRRNSWIHSRKKVKKISVPMPFIVIGEDWWKNPPIPYLLSANRVIQVV